MVVHTYKPSTSEVKVGVSRKGKNIPRLPSKFENTVNKQQKTIREWRDGSVIKAFATPPEDHNLVPRTHSINSQPSVTPAPKDLMSLSSRHRHKHKTKTFQ